MAGRLGPAAAFSRYRPGYIAGTMEMFRDVTWLGYAVVIVPICVLMGAGIDWWMGVLFGLGCALLPALAWVTQNTSD